mmetsp:Transcript_22898/g.38331  ORF Transcript_22898/g.38331 Transcript_22898/m.38331 type:complete len:291 (+) Transcript_22898:22-894(+)
MVKQLSFVVNILLVIYTAHAWVVRSRLVMGITPGTIIGAGRIGSQFYESNGMKDKLLTSRDDVVTADSTGPIYICTRNNDLDKIIETTPTDRRKDLVFLQNGMLTNYLKEKGLSENSQALIYYAVSAKGEKPIDGVTDLNPEGLTAVTGLWGADFAERLTNAGLKCHVYDKPDFTTAMLEKHIWICAFMAVGAKHGCTVGEVESKYNDEVRALIRELMTVAAAEEGVIFPVGAEDRLCAYARSVAHFPTALKEFEWRNGWFADISKRAIAASKSDPCPLHTDYLKAAGLM